MMDVFVFAIVVIIAVLMVGRFDPEMEVWRQSWGSSLQVEDFHFLMMEDIWPLVERLKMKSEELRGEVAIKQWI